MNYLQPLYFSVGNLVIISLINRDFKGFFSTEIANHHMSKCIMLWSDLHAGCTCTLVAVILVIFYFSEKLPF